MNTNTVTPATKTSMISGGSQVQSTPSASPKPPNKKESIPLLDHDWTAKITMPNQYDKDGNQISFGFTIYECLRCQEQYKSTDGTAPPALNPGGTAIPGGDGSGDGEEEEGFLGWLMRKIGEVLGVIGDGIISRRNPGPHRHRASRAVRALRPHPRPERSRPGRT